MMTKYARILSTEKGSTKRIVHAQVPVSIESDPRERTQSEDTRFMHLLDGTRNTKSAGPRASADIKASSLERDQSSIEVHAFAEGRVIVDGRRVRDEEWRSGRAKEMFFYLLCSDMPKTRQQIAVDIWPDLSPAKSTSNFHISLYRARHALFPEIVFLDEGRYRIPDDIRVWFDFAEFSRAINETRGAPIESARQAAHLQTALDLYAGPFLPTVYSEWAEERRRETEVKYLKALRKLVRWYCESGDLNKALGLVDKLAAFDPYNDDLLCDVEGWRASIKMVQPLLNEFRRLVERPR